MTCSSDIISHLKESLESVRFNNKNEVNTHWQLRPKLLSPMSRNKQLIRSVISGELSFKIESRLHEHDSTRLPVKSAIDSVQSQSLQALRQRCVADLVIAG